ncbi:p13 [Clostera anastomosis granulovirus A]|uniref:P13 n=1 Tax=Clostera anastomosis granulovirus A TaxID=1986289 RepID=U5KBT8_9BBAC|nr:p13 [Clostera anastomosis granulovirus Henan]AGQ20284.1 p13 [Clostera anastomosis granulovirus Henan]
MKCAYVTLVMRGDAYVDGAIALANSIRATNTKYDLVCMITNDVTRSEELRELFTRVVCVPYWHFSCGQMLTDRQRQLYGNWINYSFTKWRCFQVMKMYERCVYMDADQVVLRNIDHLFEHSYAICFNDRYDHRFKRFRHGDVIGHEDHAKILRGGGTHLGFTGTMVFTPNVSITNEIASLLSPENPLLSSPVNVYNNGFDEIVLAQTMVNLKVDVTQLSHVYVWNAGDYSSLRGREPYVVNYYGDRKPWVNGVEYMDVFVWRYFRYLHLV